MPGIEMRDPLRAPHAGLLAAGTAGVVAMMLLTACSPDSQPQPSPQASSQAASTEPADLSAFYDQQVRWQGCEGSFDCTKVKVPLDYSEPAGEVIELDVVRQKAEDPRGSLVLNPGGPGGSGVEYARAARVVVTRAVAAAYDVVGFDPRGVVGSDPVDCVEDEQLDAFFTADGTPDDVAEKAALVDQSAQFGTGCKERSPGIGSHMDTIAAARDMDILRAVLGDDKLNLLGKSYGTLLGATYAQMFPERVGRFVLDGVLPSSLDADEVSHGQAKAFDVALRRFVADCANQDDCPLPRGVDKGVQRIQDFLADLDEQPIDGIEDRKLTEALAANAILSYLYFPPTDWDVLRFGLGSAFAGDGSVLLEMFDERVERGQDGTYANNGNEAFLAVSCLDRPSLGGVEHTAELAEDWAHDAPVFGSYLAWSNLTCWRWPLPVGSASAAGSAAPGGLVVGQPAVINAKGADPILVVSTVYDPATPHEWGVQVAEELESATLLTYDADGHTAYRSGSTCIDDAVDAYLLKGELPKKGTECRSDDVEADVAGA
ncbi:MAG: alpha/beta hydrolase [Candidatus Nanopelagicales bacterium]